MVLTDDLVTEHTDDDKARVAFIQLVFRARLVKRAVRKLSQNVLRAAEPLYTTPELIETLQTPPAQRESEQLDELLQAFHSLAFFQTLSELQQAQCCRSLGEVHRNLNDVVYSAGDVGTTFYIVLAGGCEMQADGGRAKLQLGVGDSFGHTELVGGDSTDHQRKTTVTALSGTILATLKRTDYLRITGNLEKEVIEILGKPSSQRSETELVLARALFKETPFFRALHYKMLQDVCCKNMTIKTEKAGVPLFNAGDDGFEYFVTIKGKVRVVLQGQDERGKAAGYKRDPKKDIILKAGSSFGEIAITSTHPKDWKRSAGIECVEDCTFAVLSRAHYLESTSSIEGRVYAALETRTQQRTNLQIQLLMKYFRSQPFFKRLSLEGLRRQACSMMFRENAAAGQILWEEGCESPDTFHIVLRGGPLREVKDGETLRKLNMGDEFGADGLTGGNGARTSTVIADDDAVLATFMKDDYLRIFMVCAVMEWVHKFWNLVTVEAFGHMADDNEHDRVDFNAYQELHKRISKTIHEKNLFNAKREKLDAEEDWKEDVMRAHHGMGGLPCVSLDSLTKAEFSDAIFQLVDVWCEHVDAMDLFVEFLKTVFGSISVFNREQKCFRYKAIGQIKSLHARLEDIRSVTLTQFEHDEKEREARREEIHAARGVEAKGNKRIRGKILRSSVLIGMMGKNSGLLENASFETDKTNVASGDLADAKTSMAKLRSKTNALLNLGALNKDGPGSPKQKGKGGGKRWLYNSKAEWESFGVVNGGPVMVKVPKEGGTARDSSEATALKELWVHGTVIASTPDRITVTYGGGKSLFLYSSNPESYSKINGFVAEYAPVGSSKNWQRHSPEISNLIVGAVDTEGVAKFEWQPQAVVGESPPKTLAYEVNAQVGSTEGSKLADWVGLQRVAGPTKSLAEDSDEAAAAAPAKLRLVRLSADDQPPEAKPRSKPGQAALRAEIAPWIAFVNKDVVKPKSRVANHSAMMGTREANDAMGAHLAEARDLHGILGEMERRLAQDHRVPELIADSDSKLTRTPASRSTQSKYTHITGDVGPPREYTLQEVKADIKRLQQRGAAWSRCDMLEEKELLLSQLKAHRNLLQSLWSYVDTGGRKGSEAQEPKRWYAGAKGQRQQRPVTGITEQLLGKRRRTAKSFTALIPKPQEGLTMGFTPEDTGLKSKSGLRHQRRSSSRTQKLPELSHGGGSSIEHGDRRATADSGNSSGGWTATLAAMGASFSDSAGVQDYSTRRPMQLERQEFLPPLQSSDRSLAKSRRSPYRMRQKAAHAAAAAAAAAASTATGMPSTSKKYAVS